MRAVRHVCPAVVEDLPLGPVARTLQQVPDWVVLRVYRSERHRLFVGVTAGTPGLVPRELVVCNVDLDRVNVPGIAEVECKALARVGTVRDPAGSDVLICCKFWRVTRSR
ncbi:hypothetical protein ASD56_07525 [Microbacterium sp. Root166]|nr:hypothetical protein ASD56_07525 [Microbacterium sp. Root166]